MLLSHTGCKRKKKGITLIELIVSMGIDLFILFICFNIITINYKNFKFLIENISVNSSIDDAVLNINRLLKTKMIENIEIDCDNLENKDFIEISYGKIFNDCSNLKIKNIYLNEKKNLTIKTDNTGYNILIRKVDTFDIVKKGKIYYLKIKMISGEERIVCL